MKKLVFILFVLTALMLNACQPVPTQAPAAEQPAAPQPAVEKPAAEKPAVEKPADEKPAAEKPAAEKPAAEAGCPVEGGKIKIGMIQPLSGPAATVGARTTAGAQFAVDQINAAGGVKGCDLELIKEDSQGDPAVGVAAAEKLLNQDKVEVLIGAYHSHVTLAVMPIIAQAEVPMLTIIATSPLITDQNNGWVFRTSSTNVIDAKTATVACWDELGFKKWAFLPVNNDWGKSAVPAFEPVIKENGGEVVMNEPVEAGSTVFNTQLTKLRASDADTVAVTTDIESVSVLAKQVFEAGMRDSYKWVVTSGNIPAQFVDLLKDQPEAAENWYFIAYYRSSDMAGGDTPANIKFTEDFSKAYPDLGADSATARGYAAVNIIAQAFERAGTYAGPALRDALKLTDYDSVAGYIKFDEKGQAYPDVHFQQIKDGKIVAIPCK